MKRFYQTFKALPPEFKVVLGFLGLGTMAGLFYLLQRQVGGRTPMLIIIGVVAVLALLVWLVIRLFGWTGRRRAARMDYELSSGEQGGPQSMDVSAKIKANNEKFFKAVRELKKTVGISVYELPWYIVIGDSGCGKTKLVNEGGLTFSTGKPEGYQLGTLDYNWWFTEDAIFIDMAGRLCNPQDDRDRREWMAFLDTVARGRKGYPINGALVCVSTEHLLRDPPEKHESDAHIALERLRDLQSKLGVTFATYLVVTKCDKILGFMQFFDRAERDIAVKNQIFGWSRPGTFNEPYDPEKFKGDFSKLYGTLNDLRLRRMNDDAEEIDLGLACAFPEEFRGLFDPLQTYIRTLFPFIRNPRAVKNLLFRGVYFTSATQEGELILKHLTERLGNEAASQFPPLDDLYPHKRPHFIKDVLMRKVFPEHGLVFRNEQQVVRNRRLSRALMVGTCVLAVLLFGGFAWSIHKYSQIIDEPRAWADKTADGFTGLRAADAPAQAAQAEQYWNRLSDNRRSARILCGFFCNPMEPGESLERIRMELVEKALKGTLGEVREALRSGAGLMGDAAALYQDALAEYVRWYACRELAGGPSPADGKGFDTLMGVVPASSLLKKDPKFALQKEWYFKQAGGTKSSPTTNPAALLAEADKDADQTIKTAVGHVSDYFARRYAAFSTDNRDETVREWVGILEACRKTDGSYKTLLTTCSDADKVPTLQELDRQKEGFLRAYESWEASLASLTSGKNLTSPLGDAMWKQREVWRAYRDRLLDAGRACTNVGAAEAWVTALNDENLDKAMWESLCSAKLAGGECGIQGPIVFADFASFQRRVKNVYDADVFGHIIDFAPSGKEGQGGAIKFSKDAETVRNTLKTVEVDWRDAKLQEGQCLPESAPESWSAALVQHIRAISAGGELGKQVEQVGPQWDRKALTNLLTQSATLLHRGVGTCLLQTVSTRLARTAREDLGLAALIPEDKRNAPNKSPYTIKVGKRSLEADPRETTDRSERVAAPAAAPDESTLPSRRVPAKKPTASTPLVTRSTSATGSTPAWATAEFLYARALSIVDLQYCFDKMAPHTLDGTVDGRAGGLPQRCRSVLGDATRAYMRTYVKEWNDAYGAKRLTELSQLVSGVTGWEQLAKKADDQQMWTKVGDQAEEALSWVIRHVALGDHTTEDGVRWTWDGSTEVNDWFRQALANPEAWSSGRWVIDVRPRESKERSPWDETALAFATAWNGLGKAVRNYQDLQTKSAQSAEGRDEIPWGDIEGLREDFRMQDERITQALVNVETWSQRLLDHRLTEILARIQDEELQGFDADKTFGWPYLKGERDTDTALQTVRLDKFRTFLKRVTTARKAFEKMEKRLTVRDLIGFEARKQFYDKCDDWEKFLSGEKLDFDVDPCTIDQAGRKWQATEDYCRRAARSVELRMGGHDSLDFFCESQDWPTKPVSKTWGLTEKADNWEVTLKDPLFTTVHFEDAHKTLGKDSALAFLAYLQRYGMPSDARRTWYVVHQFKVKFDGDKDSITVGQVFRFDLKDKRLPEGIPRLNGINPPDSLTDEDIAGTRKLPG